MFSVTYYVMYLMFYFVYMIGTIIMSGLAELWSPTFKISNLALQLDGSSEEEAARDERASKTE